MNLDFNSIRERDDEETPVENEQENNNIERRRSFDSDEE